MPLLDGFGVPPQPLHKTPGIPATAIMILTSGGQRGDVERCRELGISGYLTKPIRQAEPRQAIFRVLGLRQQGETGRNVVTRHALQDSPKGLRILLAEDNAVNRELAVRILSKRGHVVTTANNGRRALEVFESRRFDVILMDMQMLEMDGIEATVAIRATRALNRPAYSHLGSDRPCHAGRSGSLPRRRNGRLRWQTRESGGTDPNDRKTRYKLRAYRHVGRCGSTPFRSQTRS